MPSYIRHQKSVTMVPVRYPNSFFDPASASKVARGTIARFAGSKTLLSFCSDQGFDSVAKVTEFADHSISAVSS